MSRLSLNVWRVVLGLSLLALTLGSARPALAYDVEDLQVTGASDKRLDLLIMGDGYTSAEQAKMTTDAQWVMDAFWDDAFFGAYKDFFNVRLVHVISNQSGADNGSAGGQRDTALGAYFLCDGVTDRLLCIDSGAVNAIAFADSPSFDQILVMVNDTKYGGSGGSISTTSVNSGAVEVPIHEVGHSLFRLADEYVDEQYGHLYAHDGECSEVNVTRNGNVSTVKWNYWADLPEVDVFLGAHYLTTGHYRPVDNCKMRSLGVPFCPICKEKAVVSLFEVASLIDGQSPAQGVTTMMEESDMQEFEVAGASPSPSTLVLRWVLDGMELASGPDRQMTFSGSDFGVGSHTLEVFIEDATSWVRVDSEERLQGSVSFEVDVAPDPVVSTGGASSGGAASGGASTGGFGTGGLGTGGVGAGGDFGAGGGAATGGSPSGGGGSGDGSSDDSQAEEPLSCSCRTSGQGGSGHGAWLTLFALGLAWARRRGAGSARLVLRDF